ncbi:TIGR03749 family integrating conjugative element protein [Vibrio jasicida]|uniref:TIGR03749 family integrating conjugative element protein n=1 Tax=Vibrio jasicida TaxID=766224 RepID=UPI0006975E74|nr:TIGR03749 family integrating conjugative element protein [Vibrio jasicida]
MSLFSRFWALALMVMLSASPVASMERAMEWEGTPLPLALTPGKELVVNFGDDVRVAMPAHLSATLSAASLGGRVYFSANAPFDVARVHVERLSDGLRVLLDVRADSAWQALSKVDIVLPGKDGRDNITEEANAPSASEALKMAPEALLVRYAMQSLYSPSYAIEPLPGVGRMPMGLTSNVQVQAFPFWAVTATPLAAWSLNDNVVTAIEVKNLSAQIQPLDPRQVALGGACLTQSCMVSFVYPELGPKGSQSDSATAFVVTPGPLRQHLLPVEASRG